MSLEPSDWFPKVNQVTAVAVGSHRRSSAVVSRHRTSAVGSRRNIKKGHMSCYNTIVKSELICVNEEVKSDMWEREKGSLRRAQGAGRRHKAQHMRIKKNKAERKNKVRRG